MDDSGPGPGQRALTRLRPVHERDVVEGTVHQLLDLVRGGDLVAGDLLPSERPAAERLQVSRPSLRLALDRVEALGVIERGDGGRARVVSGWVPLDEPTSPPALAAEDLLHLLEARRAIEPQIAVLAATRATDADLDTLQATVAEQERHGSDRVRAVQAEGRFHRQLWRIASNPVLEDAIRTVFRRLEVGFDMAMRTDDDVADSLRVHVDTLAALRTGDPQRTLDAMDGHLALMEAIYEDVTGRPFARRSPLAGAGR